MRLVENYPQGNLELLKLFKETPFSELRAGELMKGIEDINAPILDESGIRTTYLCEAADDNNVRAVEMLLEHGANPNYVNEDLINDCALWDLQYFSNGIDEETKKEEIKVRYEIAKLFFKYGGNPNLTIENDRETLYDYVLFKVLDREEYGYDYDLLINFYKLLAAYGGGGTGGYSKAELYENFDLQKIDDYHIEVTTETKNGRLYIADMYMVDSEGNHVAHM